MDIGIIDQALPGRKVPPVAGNFTNFGRPRNGALHAWQCGLLRDLPWDVRAGPAADSLRENRPNPAIPSTRDSRAQQDELEQYTIRWRGACHSSSVPQMQQRAAL